MVRASALAVLLLAAAPLASANIFACVACPPGFYHIGCDELTSNAGALAARAPRRARARWPCVRHATRLGTAALACARPTLLLCRRHHAG
jgi:hypothetical protein